MTAPDYDALAQLHEAAFPHSRGWSAAEIRDLAEGVGGFLVRAQTGFALGRAIAGEAELLTIAVDPAARRQGAGRALMAAFEAAARDHGASDAFLEVAEDNAPARALYAATGWSEAGRRPRYYARAGGAVDAILMRRTLG